ncbi:unnamed protein product [Prunus armeniaca]
MRSVHKTNTTIVVIYFKHEGNQIEEAQLEEQVNEQVDDEGTETDDVEGTDEEGDNKDHDFVDSDYEQSEVEECLLKHDDKWFDGNLTGWAAAKGGFEEIAPFC